MYLEQAEKEDNKVVERWRADAGVMLVFAGLFSSAVAQLVVISIQDLRPNPQDTTNFYLQNIYGLLANLSAIENASVPSPLAKPPSFSPQDPRSR
ncbi:hypothetical protein BC826DRAFT_158598 [Russula brevipes]|nr:hypothetical protein BC826DRAFT_158598 [Russula brevipes]